MLLLLLSLGAEPSVSALSTVSFVRALRSLSTFSAVSAIPELVLWLRNTAPGWQFTAASTDGRVASATPASTGSRLPATAADCSFASTGCGSVLDEVR